MYINFVLRYMAKKQGEKLKVGEVKTAIILYILENKESVSEPDIRKHLREKFGVRNQGTINDHLHKLEDIKCIESITPNRKIRSNFWDITKLEHLKNIRHEFPKILINSYEKSIMIIFKERGYSLNKVDNLDFYIKLILSVSLFDAFLDADIKELIYKSEKIYLRDDGYIKVKNYEYHVDKFLKLYKEANPDFKIPSELSIYKRHLSKEAFFKIFENFKEKTDEMIKELDEAFKKFKDLDKDFDEKPGKILLNHFINHDIFKGIESPDEYGFFNDLKDGLSKADNIWIKEGNLQNIDRLIELIHLEELKVYSEIIKKHKQPSMFYFSENPDKVLDGLIDFYKDQI